MSKTIDAGTPIFGALNEELGLPDFDVHDFDVHAFDFLRAEEATESATSTAAQHGNTAQHGNIGATAPPKASASKPNKAAGKAGSDGPADTASEGKRRKKN